MLRPRTGLNLSFVDIVRAIHHVYNISYPLAIFLAFGGLITSGKFSFRRATPSGAQPFHDAWYSRLLLSILSALTYFWTLDLSSLSARGSFKITHDASLVHLDTVPSTGPDPQMLRDFMEYATEASNNNGHGISLLDIAHYHARRERTSGPLDATHKRIALGECAFTWLMLRGSVAVNTTPAVYTEHVIPPERLQQWLGEERLPDGWWDEGGVRPSQVIGLRRVRQVASIVERFVKKDTDS